MPDQPKAPEGAPHRCPTCGSEIAIPGSQPIGEIPCPACGCSLWFVRVRNDCWFFDRATISKNGPEEVAKMLQLGTLDLRDSIAIVELVMALEE